MSKVNYFHCRLTNAELAQLRRLAEAADQPEAEVVRVLIRSAAAIQPAIAIFETHSGAGVRQDTPRAAAA